MVNRKAIASDHLSPDVTNSRLLSSLCGSSCDFVDRFDFLTKATIHE